MGTNNPSEEQMELVTGRVIEIAQSLAEEACMLEAQGYFDECGFDLEARGAALTAKLKQYIKDAEDVDPNSELICALERPSLAACAQPLIVVPRAIPCEQSRIIHNRGAWHATCWRMWNTTPWRHL